MNVIRADIEDVLILELDVYRDERGHFMESWNAERYRTVGIMADFVQDNVSFSFKHVLRGLHFQNPTPQGKLVTVLKGEVFDVVVDIRLGSPTYMKWISIVLSSENNRQLFVPEGFAHGFLVMSEQALVNYKCTGPYHNGAEHGIRWDDPSLAIKWPVEKPTLSTKDGNAPFLNDIPQEHLFRYKPLGSSLSIDATKC